MIKELMLITTIIYGNAIPTFDNVEKQQVKHMNNEYNQSISMGTIYIDIIDNNNQTHNEIPLTFDLPGLIYGFDYANYMLQYYYTINCLIGDSQTQRINSNDIELDYDVYGNLIDNINSYGMYVDIGNITTIIDNNLFTRLHIDVYSGLTIYSVDNQYELNNTFTMDLLLHVGGSVINNFTITNIYTTYFSGYDMTTYLDDNNGYYFDKGYNSGYNEGYDIGFNTGNMDFNPTTWLIDSVSGFMSFEIFPNFSIGGLLMTITGALITLYIMKLLLGG